MHFNFPILIIVFPIFHNFFSFVGYMSGGISHGGGYCPVGICPRGNCPDTIECYSSSFIYI